MDLPHLPQGRPILLEGVTPLRDLTEHQRAHLQAHREAVDAAYQEVYAQREQLLRRVSELEVYLVELRGAYRVLGRMLGMTDDGPAEEARRTGGSEG